MLGTNMSLASYWINLHGRFMNRYRIVGAMALIWGGGLLLAHLLGFRRVEGSGVYAAGQYAGLVFGGLLFAAGLYTVITGGRKKS